MIKSGRRAVIEKSEEPGNSHTAVTADCGFCDYQVLEEVETQREEEFYIPDRRYETDKKKAHKNGRYVPSDFTELEAGGYRCPAGREMIKRTKGGYNTTCEVWKK